LERKATPSLTIFKIISLNELIKFMTQGVITKRKAYEARGVEEIHLKVDI
jgi:hypothetical protein